MDKKVPMRQCVGCGEMKDKRSMLRVVKTPDDQIVLDSNGKQNGRGAYVCRNVECFRRAIRSKGLERSLKTTIPKDISDCLEQEINIGQQQ